jgi:hypothetical protein
MIELNRMIVFLLLSLCVAVCTSVSVNNEIPFPKLLFMVQKETESVHTLNQIDSLSNKLKTGWVIPSDTKITFLLYLIVDEEIKTLNDIQESQVKFTTDEFSCDDKQNDEDKDDEVTNAVVYKIKFDQERSKLYTDELIQLQQDHLQRVQHSSAASQIQINDDYANNNTLLAGEITIKLPHASSKYYTCLNFAKKTKRQEIPPPPPPFIHQGDDHSLNIYNQIITTKELLPLWLVIILYLILLSTSALFSGLNLGLMSLSLQELQLIINVGRQADKDNSDKKAAREAKKDEIYATKILPLRRKGNLLLCTILLGNVLVNSVSVLILGNYLEGIFAAIGSTMLIVIFGEIIPQAICSRKGLFVGATTRYFTWCTMGFVFIVAYPMSIILDYMLGKEEVGAGYTRDKVAQLMMKAKEGQALDDNQYKLVEGALAFKDRNVKDVMVKISNVFSLDIDSLLDFDTFKLILEKGYSRIPVYEHSKYSFFIYTIF